MATAREKGTRKTNSGLGVQHLEKSGGVEKKNATVEKEETHQPTPPEASLEPPRKGRGRPKKVTAVDVPTNEDQDPAPSIEDLPRKRVRNDAKPASGVEIQPVSKRLKVDNAEVPQVPRQQRKAGDIPPRDPLPDRKGRNVHPGPKKATRRSHQVCEAEREAKAKAIEEQIQKLEMAKRLLAEANAFEDIENDTMDQNPQRLSTVIQKRKRVDDVGDSDDGELFNFKEVDEMKDTSGDEDGEPVKQKVVSVNLREN